MKYDLIVWLHDYSTDPSMILLEYNSKGEVPRMLEIYKSGKVVLKRAENNISVVSGTYPALDEVETLECTKFRIDQSDFIKRLELVTQVEPV